MKQPTFTTEQEQAAFENALDAIYNQRPRNAWNAYSLSQEDASRVWQEAENYLEQTDNPRNKNIVAYIEKYRGAYLYKGENGAIVATGCDTGAALIFRLQVGGLNLARKLIDTIQA